SYFWWVEMEDMPAASMILPEDWDKAKRRNINPLHVKGKVGGANSVVVSGGASRVTLYLSPDVVNFEQPLRLTVTGTRKPYPPGATKPSIGGVLEEGRRGGARQHPFWTKMVVKDAGREVPVGAAREKKPAPGTQPLSAAQR